MPIMPKIANIASLILEKKPYLCALVRAITYTSERIRPPKETVTMGNFSFGFPKILSWRTDEKLVIGKFCMFATEGGA